MPDAPGRDQAPLSVAQEAMWYSTRLHPRRLAYNETVPIVKTGPLDVEALRQTLRELIRRHESLRTRLPVVDGRPTQVIGEVPDLDLAVIDLSHLGADEAEREALARVGQVSSRPYDLRNGPLLRTLLFRFPEEEHRLYLAIHHLAFDGVSLVRVLMPELAVIYEAFSEGRPSPLPEPPVRYVDYARWEQQWITTPKAERRLSYWVDRLSAHPSLVLPLDHERPEEPRRGGGAVPLSLPVDQTERLRLLGREADATLFQVLAAGWSLLLSHCAGQEDIVFSTAADLRQRPELQSVFGCCLTSLVLQVEVTGDLAFTDLVRRTRNDLLDGLGKIVPFERVVRRLPPPPETHSGNPIYSTMIVLEPAPERPDSDWALQLIEPKVIDATGVFKLDLELEFHEEADGSVIGQLLYDRDLFERSTAASFVAHFETICAAVAADPTVLVADVPRPATTSSETG
jgi:hypothetical protein